MMEIVRAQASEARQSPPMNRTEAAYEYYLNGIRGQGAILEIAFEPEKLRLGTDHACTYLPDFRVVTSEGIVEFHEVKGTARTDTKLGHSGYWRGDARVKIKAADAAHPYIFRAVHLIPKKLRRKNPDRHWSWETITPDVEEWEALISRLFDNPNDTAEANR